MKRTVFPVAFAFIIALAFTVPQQARAQLGVAAGANFNSLSDIEGGTESATGYHVGLFYDMSLGPVAIRPGIFYMDVGELQYENEEGELQNFSLQMIQIPIDARFRLGVTPFVSPYVMAGPVFRINTSAEDFEGEANDFSMAANAGVGVEIALPGSGLRLYPEILYTFGVSAIAEEAGFPGEDNEARLNNFLVRLGVTF